MIKEAKIKDLVYGKLGTILESAFDKHGFKYLKSKKYFSRQSGIFTQQICLHYPDSPISYDEDKEEIYLEFYLSPQISIPDFEKWHKEIIGEEAHYTFRTTRLSAFINLSIDDFDQDDFYTPSKSQQFKRFVSMSLMGASTQKNQPDMFYIDELINNKLVAFIAELSEKSEILYLFENRAFPFEGIYVPLLIFGGYKEKAKEFQDTIYQYYIEQIEELTSKNDDSLGFYITGLEEFIETSKKLLNTKYDNPFERKIKINGSKNEAFDFADDLKFKETLRLDISKFDVRSCHINANGDIFLNIDDKKIVRLNPKGELVLEKDIELGKEYERFCNVKTGLIQDTGEYFFNNYIVRHNATILELPLNINIKKNKKLINPHITDIAYSKTKEKCHVLYQNKFISYDANGNFEKEIVIETGYAVGIEVEKEWIIAQQRDKAILILDFDGKLIHSFDYGNGNNYYEFSKSFEYLVCFFYSTKSQFYQLANKQQKTLWAHPTFIKNYKELMYNDINHNFGMECAKFSPDEKYLVGGACHGKYVAWKLPKLERMELIPQKELLNLMSYSSTLFTNEGTQEIVTKPELVELENQTFLKNRGNSISKIFFFENGDIFLTELGYGNFILSWNRNFENLKYYKVEGRIDLHSEKYLTQRNKNELIIYLKE